MSETKKRFAIRDGIKGHERQNAMLQASYDTVDRMVALIGDVTFNDLFNQSFNELIPRILPNVDLAASYGLIEKPDEVTVCFDRLLSAHAEHSFRSMAVYMTGDDAILSRDYFSAAWKLIAWHGIRLPEFQRDPLKNEDVLKAMDALLETAGDLNYRDLFVAPAGKDMRAIRSAASAAADCFIIYLPLPNHTCCNNNSCVPANSSNYCSVTSGVCTANSTQCLGGGGR